MAPLPAVALFEVVERCFRQRTAKLGWYRARICAPDKIQSGVFFYTHYPP